MVNINYLFRAVIRLKKRKTPFVEIGGFRKCNVFFYLVSRIAPDYFVLYAADISEGQSIFAISSQH